MTDALCVIVARRGSKGVPGKNMAMVAGRPCLAWSIDAALQSCRVGRVVVSTDWSEAAELASGMGAEPVARPAGLASDTATVDDAVRHAVTEVDVAGDSSVVILYANVPVRPTGLLDRAVEMLARERADSVQSFSPVGKHHPWWTCRVDADGRVAAWEGDRLFHGIYRRQELPPAHVPDGGVIAVTREALFLRAPGAPSGPHAFLGREDRRRGVLTGEGEVVDIDSEIDLMVADAVLRGRRGVEGRRAGAVGSAA